MQLLIQLLLLIQTHLLESSKYAGYLIITKLPLGLPNMKSSFDQDCDTPFLTITHLQSISFHLGKQRYSALIVG